MSYNYASGMHKMEFTENELETIKTCLEERQIQLNKYIKEWEKAKWDNIGSMQNMYANEQAFNEHKEMLIKNWKQENEKIDSILTQVETELYR